MLVWRYLNVSRVRHRLPEIDTVACLLVSRRRCQYGLQPRYLRCEHTIYRLRSLVPQQFEAQTSVVVKSEKRASQNDRAIMSDWSRALIAPSHPLARSGCPRQRLPNIHTIEGKPAVAFTNMEYVSPQMPIPINEKDIRHGA